MKRIALIGECLIELNGTPFGTLHQTYGGDSLNTAIYLARLTHSAANVKYVSALGTDALSATMLDRWTAECIDTHLVLRDPMRLPGMYWIQIDALGEGNRRHVTCCNIPSSIAWPLRWPWST